MVMLLILLENLLLLKDLLLLQLVLLVQELGGRRRSRRRLSPPARAMLLQLLLLLLQGQRLVLANGLAVAKDGIRRAELLLLLLLLLLCMLLMVMHRLLLLRMRLLLLLLPHHHGPEVRLRLGVGGLEVRVVVGVLEGVVAEALPLRRQATRIVRWLLLLLLLLLLLQLLRLLWQRRALFGLLLDRPGAGLLVGALVQHRQTRREGGRERSDAGAATREDGGRDLVRLLVLVRVRRVDATAPSVVPVRVNYVPTDGVVGGLGRAE